MLTINAFRRQLHEPNEQFVQALQLAEDCVGKVIDSQDSMGEPLMKLLEDIKKLIYMNIDLLKRNKLLQSEIEIQRKEVLLLRKEINRRNQE